MFITTHSDIQNAIGGEYENAQQVMLAAMHGEVILTDDWISSLCFDIGLRRLCWRPVTEIDERFCRWSSGTSPMGL
jgi:hypothetical protein